MWNRLALTLGLSSLCFALATPADASISSRIRNFTITCTGLNQTASIDFTGFPAASVQNILGGEVTLFENHGGFQFILLRAQGDSTKQILSLSLTDNRAQVVFPGVGFSPASFPTAAIPVTIPASGILNVTVDGACNTGTGQIQGNVTIWLYNNP